MSRQAETLVRMANQIAAFFHPYPEAEAVAGTREHLVAFWTPRMRDDLLALWRAGAAGLDPVVVSALRGMPGGDSPIEKAVAGPETAGALTSDAG
ncbi:formate dehydrogenase subunit delta [Paracraurococcus lichenis]|uniref:Formate dehydrogenase subunit delta n=1 Tax=Paracraurococcus lichenis TaxID=3064888 RepID=A0ABT9E315_9PROT|nr:formate dehydrogenase subunit delta [Paracraurococcus sp. LOR1-02]MDO9710554.1 formate dehydrogenase subunit delta [Paracraurococcus sp. LOR1-02]